MLMIVLETEPGTWVVRPVDPPGPDRTAEVGAVPPGPTLAQYRANVRDCPHHEPLTDAERPGCGCSVRCNAGHGNHPQGGTDILNCWTCPLAPRLASDA